MDRDKLVKLAQQAENAWGDVIDADQEINGGDAVEWLGDFVLKLREAMRAITTPREIIDNLLDAAQVGAVQLTEYSEEDGPLDENGVVGEGDSKADYEERAVTAWQAITAAREYLKSGESK
jgi:hypothetical protein